MRLIRHEVYRATHDILIWISILATILVGVVLAILYKQQLMGVPTEYLAATLMSNPFVVIWSGVFLVPTYYSLSIKSRTFYVGLLKGFRSISICYIKILFTYAFGTLALLMALCSSLLVVRPESFTLALKSLDMLTVSSYLLFGMSVLTVASLIALTFQDVFLCVAANAVLSFILMKLSEIADFQMIILHVTDWFLSPSIHPLIPAVKVLLILVLNLLIGGSLGALALVIHEKK